MGYPSKDSWKIHTSAPGYNLENELFILSQSVRFQNTCVVIVEVVLLETAIRTHWLYNIARAILIQDAELARTYHP